MRPPTSCSLSHDVSRSRQRVQNLQIGADCFYPVPVMPSIEEVVHSDQSELPKHTNVKMGGASRLQAFADGGGMAAVAATQEEEEQKAASAASDQAPPDQVPTWDGAAGRRRAADESGAAGAAGQAENEQGAVEVVKELTEEEQKSQEEMLVRARALKGEGNTLFGAYDYDAAVQKYSEAIEAAPKGHKEQSVFFNNRATCYFKQV